MGHDGVFGFLLRRRLILSAVIALAVIAALKIPTAETLYKRHKDFGKSCTQIHKDTGAKAQCVFLYFATTRNLKGKDAASANSFNPVSGFGNRFADALTYGRAEVSLPNLASKEYPEGRKRGVVEHAEDAPPATAKQTEKYVTLTTITKAKTQTAFFNELSDAVGDNSDSVLLFIHGFNVDFDSAVIRTAQLAVDLTFNAEKPDETKLYEFGQPVLFSWPNGGVPFTYIDDRRLAKKSAEHLSRFLDGLTEKSNAQSINIIVHSMGNRVLVEALKEFVKQYSEDASDEIEFKIIQAAADVDQDVYDKAMTEIAQSNFKAEYTIYASSEDTPLRTSRIVNAITSLFQRTKGRLGEIIDGDIYVRRYKADRDRFTSIDATGFATDLYGHGYFSNAGNIIADISCLLNGTPPSKRALVERNKTAEQKYWEADSSKCACAANSAGAYTSDAEQFLEWTRTLSTDLGREIPLDEVEPAPPAPESEPEPDPSPDPDPDPARYPSVQYKDCWDGSNVPVTAECPPQIVEEQSADLDPLSFTVYFGYKTSTITPQAVELIEQAAARALADDIYDVVVVGHTDTVGPEASNYALSEQRARVVRDALIANGVPADRIRTEARGETDPAKPTGDDVREPLNRRVEVVIRFE